MLLPKELNTESNRRTRHGMAHRGNRVDFGDFGMKATAKGQMTGRQIESAQRTITKFTASG